MADIHYQQPGFMAMPETDGHGDTCGIDAMLAYLAVRHAEPLTLDTVDTLRATFIGHGWFNGGMTINSIVDAMHGQFGITALKMVPWGAVTETGMRSDFQQASIARQAIIFETNYAFNLPDNQPGVNRHFCCIWGIDSTLGYWTANGDTLTALRSTSPISPVWYTWSNLLAASIQAYAIFPAVVEEPPMIIIEQSNGEVTGAYDQANPHLRVSSGMAKDIQAHNETELTIADGETYIDAHHSIATFAAPSGQTPQVKTYSPQFGVISYGGEDLQLIVHELLARPVEVAPAVSTPVDNSVDTKGAIADLTAFLGPVLDAVKKLGG